MNIARHKETGKLVTAFKIMKSLEWKGKEREFFIAPYHEVGNWDELRNKGIKEVEVCFVVGHYRKKTDWVNPHFRIKTEGAIENYCNESEEHKLAKETIYTYAVNDRIILSNLKDKKISELNEVDDIKIEKGVGSKRADVLVDFKEFDKLYGKGIAFEIQISPQGIDKTIKRSYDRAAEGYSIVWLWSKDLEDFNSKVELIPYNKAIDEYQNQIKEKFNQELWDISKRTDEKVNEIKNRINISLKEMSDKKEFIGNDITQLLKRIEETNEWAEKHIQDNLKKEIEEKVKNIDLLPKIGEYFDREGQRIFEANINYFLKNKEEFFIEQTKNYLSDIVKSKINIKDIEELAKKAINNVSLNFDKSLKQSVEEKSDFINKEIKQQLYLKVKNEFDEITKDYFDNNKNIQKEINKKLLGLKWDNLKDYQKNKTSLYIECSKCKRDHPIQNTSIKLTNGKQDVICDKCEEEKEGGQEKDKN